MHQMATIHAPHFTSGKSNSMFFNDARSCKEWLKTIPLTNVVQAQQSMLDALRMLNADSHFGAIERLTSMELMRDKLSYLLSVQRQRYIGKTLPLPHAEMAAWNTSHQLIHEMESGYRCCYHSAQTEDGELAQHTALIIQRIIRYIGLSMLMAGFIYRRFDSTIWMRLHLQFIEAETRGVVNTRVKDSVGTTDGYSSVEQAYVAVLLGQLANMYELAPRDIDFTDAILKRFSQKVTVVKADALSTSDDLFLAVDVLSNAGANFHAGIGGAEHVRVLKTDEMSKSLRRRVRKLAAGDEPQTLDLPSDWNAADASVQLTRLHRLWCEGAASRPMSSIPAEHNAIVAFGIAETHFFLSGDLFEQPDVKREMSRQETNDIAMFGRVSESTIRARYAEFNYGSETWAVIDESRGQLRLIRPTNSSRGVAIGRLVGIRVANTVDSTVASNDFYLGVIRELVEETPNQYTVTLAMMPGKPEATSVRSSDNKSRTATYAQGFRLPPMESLGIPETLVIPANLAQRGRGIDIFHPDHGSAKQVNLIDFVERQADFDRVTIGG
jgi:cyclic-di-GMP-binding protein